MDYSQIIEDNSYAVNRMVSKQLRFVLILIFIVWILNMKEVFIINQEGFNKVMLMSAVLLLLPTVLVDIIELKHVVLKYLIILCTILFVSLLYMFLTYHAVLMFILPLVIACLYFDVRLTAFTIVCSLLAMTFSHVMSLFVTLMGSDPLHSLYKIIVYGLLPRAIEYIAISAVLVLLTVRTSRLFKSFITYSNDIKQSRDSLDVIVSNTNSMFQANNERDLAIVVFTAFKCLVSARCRIESDYQSFFGIADGSVDHCETFKMFMDDLSTETIKKKQDNIIVWIDGKEMIFPCYSKHTEPSIEMQKGCIVLLFYEQYELNAFLVLKNRFESQNISQLKQELEIMYGNLKLALSNTRLKEEMYETQEELVRAFAEISESKSKQTGQHIKRVSEYMRVMATAIHLSEKEINNLAVASMMHDIGKLMIPSEIIEKKGKLTEEEFEEVKKHVHYGYELLRYSPGQVMELAKVIALQHHEKWDGSGYLGMKGEQIDYYSRIMAVVDVFDALISKRSYKEKWSLEAAYNEIVSQSGKHFDPAVVKIFCDHFSEFEEITKKYPD